MLIPRNGRLSTPSNLSDFLEAVVRLLIPGTAAKSTAIDCDATRLIRPCTPESRFSAVASPMAASAIPRR